MCSRPSFGSLPKAPFSFLISVRTVHADHLYWGRPSQLWVKALHGEGWCVRQLATHGNTWHHPRQGSLWKRLRFPDSQITVDISASLSQQDLQFARKSVNRRFPEREWEVLPGSLSASSAGSWATSGVRTQNQLP